MSDLKNTNLNVDQETERVLKMRSTMKSVANLDRSQMTPASVTKFVTGRGR